MNPITSLLNKFTRKRKPYLHEPIKFQESSFQYTCTRCPRIVHTAITWEEYAQGKVRELQTQGLCQVCNK